MSVCLVDCLSVRSRTSSFLDNVMLSYNGLVYSSAVTECDKHKKRDSNLISLNDKDHQVLIVSCTPRGGAKSAIYKCLVVYVTMHYCVGGLFFL